MLRLCTLIHYIYISFFLELDKAECDRIRISNGRGSRSGDCLNSARVRTGDAPTCGLPDGVRLAERGRRRPLRVLRSTPSARARVLAGRRRDERRRREADGSRASHQAGAEAEAEALGARVSVSAGGRRVLASAGAATRAAPAARAPHLVSVGLLLRSGRRDRRGSRRGEPARCAAARARRARGTGVRGAPVPRSGLRYPLSGRLPRPSKLSIQLTCFLQRSHIPYIYLSICSTDHKIKFLLSSSRILQCITRGPI